uniref:Uncharacterized protein n=1 Tax=Arundo donax TaxID=35708 RepID=A0A0A9GT11_ARUDO
MGILLNHKNMVQCSNIAALPITSIVQHRCVKFLLLLLNYCSLDTNLLEWTVRCIESCYFLSFMKFINIFILWLQYINI